MIRNFAALISLAVVFSGSLALSTQSVEAKTSEAKTSRNSSARARNYLVPPPPPYVPSIGPWTLGMTNAQAFKVGADEAGVNESVNPYGKHVFTRNQSDMPQVVQPNPNGSYDPGVEKSIQKHIDSFDSDISSVQKEIGKLLNL